MREPLLRPLRCPCARTLRLPGRTPLGRAGSTLPALCPQAGAQTVAPVVGGEKGVMDGKAGAHDGTDRTYQIGARTPEGGTDMEARMMNVVIGGQALPDGDGHLAGA